MDIFQINNTYFGDKMNDFINVVYNHFIDLANYANLNHSVQEIKKLLTSDNFKGYIVKHKNKYIIGYILGEITHLNDGRDVYFITYLYTASNFRKLGIASKLINHIKTEMKKQFIYTIMLICNTDNSKLVDFYMKKGFMLDLLLRRYEKHDVFSALII